MKIEKINENQLKFTLAPEDLSIRGLILSELYYSSEKTNRLYSELVNKALTEFGFEANGESLMIESIPTETGSLILIVTKNAEAEELDTRFSTFSVDKEASEDEFVPFQEVVKDNNEPKSKGVRLKVHKPLIKNTRIYVFKSLDDISVLAKLTLGQFNGESTVYKNESNGYYYLVLKRLSDDQVGFSKIHNIALEFSSSIRANYATFSVISEHYTPIIREKALDILAKI